MKKNYIKASLTIMVGLFIFGLILLFNSTNLGQDAGSTAMRANGGFMDTQQYNYIISSTTENYRTAGMVISLVGGFGTLLSGYGLYREL